MVIGLLGDNVVSSAVAEQIANSTTAIEHLGAADVAEQDLLVAAWTVGDERFDTVNGRLADAEATLVAIELGGIGGLPIESVEGAISILSPTGPCYRCLRTRVEAANSEAAATPERDDSFSRLAGVYAGRLIDAADTDENALPIGHVIEFPVIERTLLPVPGCVICDQTERWEPALPNASEHRTLDAAITAVERAHDDRLGIVTGISEAASIPLPYYLATVASTRGFSDVDAPSQAAGVSVDWNEAFMKAMGEALERYGAGVYRESSFTYVTTQDRDDVIAPDAFVQPTPICSPSQELPWVPAVDVSTEAPWLVPAEVVVFPPPSRHIRPAITTGLSIDSTATGAVLGGLLEVIERDAAMLAWYSAYEPLGIDVADHTFDRLTRLAAVERLRVSVTVITQDIDVPIIAAAVHRDDEWPRFAMGSAASLDPVDATIGATQEALQNWTELNAMGHELATEEEPRIAGYADDPREASQFVDPEITVPASQLTSPVPDTPEMQVEHLASLAGAAGLTCLAASITPRDMRALGFEAVRVVIPEAQPLFTGSAYFGERARTVPSAMGYRARPDREPHPFP